MDFNYFFKNIPKVLKEDLPSTLAHLKMAPAERKEIVSDMNYKNKSPRKAAVMMLFYPKNEITHLVLIKRNSYPGVHSSQIAFPGGKMEFEDFNLEITALRETHEEIGIHPDFIKVLRPFSEIYIPPSNFLVHPFLGISHSELKFELQEEEVAGIIELPLTQFLDDEIVVMKRMNTSYATDIEVPCFKVEEHYIWGATAMILSELKETLKKVL